MYNPNQQVARCLRGLEDKQNGVSRPNTREEGSKMDKPAEEMTDEELAQAINPVEEKPEEVIPEAVTPELEAEAEPVAEEEAQEESTNEAPEDKPPSRRETLRIQQLLQKYGDPAQRQAPSQRRDVLDYSEALDADPEVIQQLLADRQRAEQTQYQAGANEGLQRAEYLNWNTSLKIEAPQVENKYPILDPKSPDFHPAVADSLNTMYLKMTGFDPNTQTVANTDISYADFIESNMELVEEIAGQKTATSTKNIAKQAAQTGLRPDGSSAKRLNLNQAPENMTTEELYAVLGQTPPKKS